MHCAPTARYQDLAPTEPERIIENCIHKQEGSCYPEGIIESNTIKQEESCYIDFLSGIIAIIQIYYLSLLRKARSIGS